MHLNKIQTLLSSEGIKSERQPDGDQLAIHLATGAVGSRVLLTYRNDALRCCFVVPVFPAVYRRSEMLTAIALANWNLPGGSFRMDVQTGEIRFESCVPILDGELTDQQVRWIIFGSAHWVARYALALLEVAVSSKDAASAIERADASVEEEVRDHVSTNTG